MSDRKRTTVERGLEQASQVFANKRSRNLIFFLLAFILILGVNAMLPLIEGDTRYTVSPRQMLYSEYLALKKADDRYALTWFSEQEILLYKVAYRVSNPDLTEEEAFFVQVPSLFEVTVNTKFFFEHVPWYMATATSIGSAILLFYTLLNYLVVVAKERNERYVLLNKEVTEMSNTVLDPVTFEPWMEETFNHRRKIAQHKANVKFALDRLEKRATHFIRTKFRKYFLKQAELPEEMTWKERRYVNTKTNLLQQLEEEYIARSVINGNVKHFKYIYPMFIYNGTNEVGQTVDNYSLIKTDGGRLAQDATVKIILTLVTTLLFAVSLTLTVVSSIQQAPLWIVINMVAKMVPLVIQIPLAFDYTEVFMNRQLISNLLNRRAIGLTYLAETQGKGYAETY
jgi:hypothetical protein